MATLPGIDTTALFPICNERGVYSLSADKMAFYEEDFEVQFRGNTFICDAVICTVYDPTPGIESQTVER
jgi:hypothetical protein